MLSVIANFASNTKVSSQCVTLGSRKIDCALYNIFDQKLDPSVTHWDDTICCKLTFTLWSCRYPERIQINHITSRFLYDYFFRLLVYLICRSPERIYRSYKNYLIATQNPYFPLKFNIKFILYCIFYSVAKVFQVRCSCIIVIEQEVTMFLRDSSSTNI